MKSNKTNKHSYKFMYIKGNIRVTICEEKYKEIKKLSNRFEYIKYLDKKNHLIHISSYDTKNHNAIDILKDTHDTLEVCLKNEVKTAIHQALLTLSCDERRIIYYLFFKDYTLKQVAELENTYKMDIMRKRNKILDKLRVLLNKYSLYVK